MSRPVPAKLNSFRTGVCPFDPFREELRAEYEDVFGSVSGDVVPGAACGDDSEDIDGSLSGTWFLEGAPDDDHAEAVVLVLDVDEQPRLGGVGASFGDFTVEGPPPGEVDEGCYDDSEIGFNWFWLDPDDDTRIHRAQGQGSCPAERPDDSRTYVR